jgi:hypothetical protein
MTEKLVRDSLNGGGMVFVDRLIWMKGSGLSVCLVSRVILLLFISIYSQPHSPSLPLDGSFISRTLEKLQNDPNHITVNRNPRKANALVESSTISLESVSPMFV